MKKMLLMLMFLCAIQSIFAQYGRFNCEVLRTVQPRQTVVYAPNVSKYDPNNGVFQPGFVSPQMDIYVPNLLPGEAANTKFPVFIYCHGTNEQRDIFSAEKICIAMAERGFTAISISYRYDYGTSFTYTGTTDIEERNFTDRVAYSNAMDVRLAMDFIGNFPNYNTYRAFAKAFTVGGFSLGAATTAACIYMDKDEVAPIFPANFNTAPIDPRYINIDEQHGLTIKSAFLFAGKISDLNYIDNNENTPIFMLHGTHDALVPIHTGRMLCSPANAQAFGGSAITERLSSLSGINNIGNFSYYFIRLNGVGHSIGLCNPEYNGSNPFIFNLWFPDFFRFTASAHINPTYRNRRFKLITPNNSTFNYCSNNLLNTFDCNSAAIYYYYANQAQTPPNNSQYPNSWCFPSPNVSYNTSIWQDSWCSREGSNPIVVPPIALNHRQQIQTCHVILLLHLC
jgi:hypothetical protein